MIEIRNSIRHGTIRLHVQRQKVGEKKREEVEENRNMRHSPLAVTSSRRGDVEGQG